MSSVIAVVTGASSGIGAATARRLAAQGYRVLCVARRADRVQQLAADIGGDWLECDVTDQAAVDALAQRVGGSLDLLVNNAGGAVGQEPLAQADFDAWETMFASNVFGTARVTKALLPALVQAAGTIIFPGFSADDLYDFRLYSLGTQVVMWATIGLVFGALVSRLLEGKRADAALAR